MGTIFFMKIWEPLDISSGHLEVYIIYAHNFQSCHLLVLITGLDETGCS